MNYFGRSPNGRYVTYNDGALCSIDKDGKLLWQYNFGFGVIPSRVVLTDSAVFVVFPEHMDEDGRAVVFDYDASTPLGRYGVTVGKKNIPFSCCYILRSIFMIGTY